mmetsp:Transcript_36336/g.58829  ORF Transcript_36336/g.58829 Transcript_36336/m.58829 type:complete len:126 (+) Transcript_36336:1294-1671(+)
MMSGLYRASELEWREKYEMTYRVIKDDPINNDTFPPNLCATPGASSKDVSVWHANTIPALMDPRSPAYATPRAIVAEADPCVAANAQHMSKYPHPNHMEEEDGGDDDDDDNGNDEDGAEENSFWS